MTVAEVNEVAQAFHDGVANQDAGALAGLYHEDGTFMPPNMPPCRGTDEIRSAMQLLLDAGASSLDVDPLDVREAGDITVEYGRYTLGIETADGPVTDKGKYIVVHENRGGETKIAYDIFNSNTPTM
jgi:uncharacterized protein (TIGR02246 family)